MSLTVKSVNIHKRLVLCFILVSVRRLLGRRARGCGTGGESFRRSKFKATWNNVSCDRFRWLSCCISLCAEGGLLQDLEFRSD